MDIVCGKTSAIHLRVDDIDRQFSDIAHRLEGRVELEVLHMEHGAGTAQRAGQQRHVFRRFRALNDRGGAFARTEGTVDLMPNDLVYYTYISEQGRPAVEPGPLIRHGDELAIFFFNEINRARPQVHALLLRVMAERSLQAFNRVVRLPHLLVFADRNRVEREETFEIAQAARDRFMMEVTIETPVDDETRRAIWRAFWLTRARSRSTV